MGPLSTQMSMTLPSLLMVTRSLTFPWMPAFFAAGGYATTPFVIGWMAVNTSGGISFSAGWLPGEAACAGAGNRNAQTLTVPARVNNPAIAVSDRIKTRLRHGIIKNSCALAFRSYAQGTSPSRHGLLQRLQFPYDKPKRKQTGHENERSQREPRKV